MNEAKPLHKTTDDSEKHTKEPPVPPTPPTPPPLSEFDKRFVFPILKPEHTKRSTEIQQKASELAKLIGATATGSREKLLALTNLEDAVIWANLDIARNG